MTFHRMILLTTSFLLSMLAVAENAAPHYICHHGENTREIMVRHDNEGASVPCEVVYKKATGEQILWRAEAEEGYCEEKARTFAAKQEGWGWACSDSLAAATQEANGDDETSMDDASNVNESEATEEDMTNDTNDATEVLDDEPESEEAELSGE